MYSFFKTSSIPHALSLLALVWGCGDTAIPVDLSALHSATITLTDDPRFAPQSQTHDALNDYRVFGRVQAQLPHRPPEDRDAAQVLMDLMLRDHRHSVAERVYDHIDRLVAEHHLDAVDWHTSDHDLIERDVQLSPDGLSMTYNFEIHLRAPAELVSLIAPSTRGGHTLAVEVDASWWGESKSVVELQIEPSRGRDAFLPYASMANDGVIDIALHLGAASHHWSAKEDLERVGKELLARGWGHVSTLNYGELVAKSGPFVRRAVVGSKASEIHLTLVEDEPSGRLEPHGVSASILESLSSREVVIVRGLEPSEQAPLVDALHARSALDRSVETLELQAKVVIFQGGAMAAPLERLYASLEDPIDILSFHTNDLEDSAAEEVTTALVDALTLTDGVGRHVPLTVTGLHRAIARSSERPIHVATWGLGDNPHTNPYSTEALLCEPCQSPAQCGAAGNLCVHVGNFHACGLACADDRGCPAGYTCAAVGGGAGLDFLPRQCVARDLTCGP